ncbi:Ribosome-binding factor A [Gammaproteobacteria bacterium]
MPAFTSPTSSLKRLRDSRAPSNTTMREFSRTDRVGAEIRRVLAEILRDQMDDHRFSRVTIHEVRVTRDLAHAKIFVTYFGDELPQGELLTLLNQELSGFLRHELAHRLRIRSMPALNFVYDEAVSRGEHLTQLIQQAVASDVARHDGQETP